MSATARDLARQVLLRVDKGAYATLALGGELERSGLSAQDRGLVTELVYGTLKQRLRLDRALAACAERSLAKLDERTWIALRLGAYQILFLRTPAHAAVNDAVEAVRRRCGGRLAGFVNALLRRLSREGEPALPPIIESGEGGTPSDQVAALSLLCSLPPWIVQDALSRFGVAAARQFLESLNQPPALWLRANSLRGSRDQALSALAAQLGESGGIGHSDRVPEAVKARGPGLFGSRAYGEGWFTVQDLGAQLVARLLVSGGALPSGPILDACAGIGGKSTHLSALTEDRVDIDAADRSPRKLELCADHAHRLGCSRVRPVQADLTLADAPLRQTYAAILLDAPCSGLGVLRRHPEARFRVTRETSIELAALQRSLLQSLWRRVAPGGLLVYSVCTYLDEEGPGQIASFLSEVKEFEVLPPEPRDGPMWAGLVDPTGAVRTWPHRDDADGFYAIRLRRR